MTAASVKSHVKSAYWSGMRDCLPFTIVVAPFAMLFGVVAVEAGLTIAQGMGFTILVIAGAAQFAALQLMLDEAAITFVLLTALAVNLRMAMYSASLVVYMGAAPLWQRALAAYFMFDQPYIVSIAKFEQTKLSLSERMAYYFGTATAVAPLWITMTWVGLALGAAIPPEYGLDFVLPIAFLGMVAPMLRTLPHVIAALTSIVVSLSLSLVALPAGCGLLIAAFCAMGMGVLSETWLER
jgi:predicted branched-subunit amino acid permease